MAVMTKYVAVNALSIPHPHNPKRTLLVHAGDVFEPPDDVEKFDVKGALESKAIRELTDEEHAADEAAQEPDAGPDDNGEGEPVDLPERPSNGASTEVWRTYLAELEKATEDVLGTLEVPEDAKRDDMIRIGDQRVTDYQDEVA